MSLAARLTWLKIDISTGVKSEQQALPVPEDLEKYNDVQDESAEEIVE